jgi:hypothetical protein
VGRRLVWLLLAAAILSGHARPVAHPVPGPGADASLAEVAVEWDGVVVRRGSAVVVAAREEAGAPACYALTAGHVVWSTADRPPAIVLVLPGDDGPRRVAATAIRRVDEAGSDLAVLRAGGVGCRPTRVGARALEAGDDVWLAGFPSPGAPRVRPGHIRATGRASDPTWIVDGTASEGDSGGPVFDARAGGLVGLIQGYWTARLVAAGGPVAAESAIGRVAVIPLAQVRALLEAWGIADLLADPR